MISAGGFLREVAQGHHELFCLWALLRLLLFFLNLPLGWCPLLSSVLHPGLFNVIGFSRVGQEFKLLRNISRWFVDIWKGFIDFLAWKPFHNTENILVNLTSLLMNCCSLVVFRSQNRGSVVGKSQDYEVVRRCSNCTLSALSRYFSRSAKPHGPQLAPARLHTWSPIWGCQRKHQCSRPLVASGSVQN